MMDKTLGRTFLFLESG